MITTTLKALRKLATTAAQVAQKDMLVLLLNGQVPWQQGGHKIDETKGGV